MKYNYRAHANNIFTETGIALDSSTSGFNGLSQTRNVKNRTRAHITGRTGNIKASGRTRVANTGISIKNS